VGCSVSSWIEKVPIIEEYRHVEESLNIDFQASFLHIV